MNFSHCFLGMLEAFLESSARTTGSGFNKELQLSLIPKTELKYIPSNKKFEFGSAKKIKNGSIMIKIPILQSQFITTKEDVVKEDVPLLIELEVLDKFRFLVNRVKN